MKHHFPFPFLVASLLLAAPSLADPPPGQSAFLNGMHDIESTAFMQSATDGCDKGWITDLRYIGTGGVPAADCHDGAIANGISIIQRLDVDGSQSFPLNPAQASGYADAFASYASACPNIHVWIVGNEPNFTANNSDPASYASPYAEAYAQVHAKLHAVPGHGSDLLLVAPASPYSPYCICSMHKIIQEIKARGKTPDGYAIHAYTQAQFPGEYGGLAGLVSSEQMSQSNDFCGYPFHWQFRIYRDWIKAIEEEGGAGKPVFITESGNACAPQAGNPCYPNQDVGYFQAMLKEIADWNAVNATKIRANTPYRFTLNDDGTGRDFAIGNRPNLLADLQNGFAQKHAWTTPKSCGGMPMTCGHDGDCAGMKICDWGSGNCNATVACGPNATCGADELCRFGTLDCVPRSRGIASMTFAPNTPVPSQTVQIDVTAAQGYTNVGLSMEHIGGAVIATKLLSITGNGPFHWLYEATLAGEGTYRATFRADPGANTVYAIGYLNIGTPIIPEQPDAGMGGGGAGGAENGGSGGVAGIGGIGGTGGSAGGSNADSCACRMGSGNGSGQWMLVAIVAMAGLRRRRLG